jgi:multicomponent Na+:H+ antiporter subunit B
MRSFVLAACARPLVPLLVLFSWYLLWRGHNAPGGGFTGGLVAAAALLLYDLAEGPRGVRKALRIRPERIAMVGLGVALVSGLVAALAGEPFLSGQWLVLDDGAGGKGLALGTPLLFDLGVYLVVVGSAVAIGLAFGEEPT